MKRRFQPHGPLALGGSERLFRDWVADTIPAMLVGDGLIGAAAECRQALSAAGTGAAPLFASSWVEDWTCAMQANLPGTRDRRRLADDLEQLRAGRRSVVVTGQQPGFLGGPLYTLYKIATAVAVARLRSEAGHPTTPVFWSGDDDEDLAEALAPVYWDGRDSRLRRSVRRAGLDADPGGRRPVGELGAGRWSIDAAAWLERAADQVPADHLGADLARLWREAVAEDRTWSHLLRAAVLRIFSGCGLLVVSGNDPGLHRAAGPVYERIGLRREELAGLVSQRGAELARAGWHAQIESRSLTRPLYRMKDGRRVPLGTEDALPDTGELRPGILLRSPIQDWLLRPAAVIVGPGEAAYLRQLDPVYRALGIQRAPLVPRFSAWLHPAGFDTARLTDTTGPNRPDRRQLEEWAAEAADGAGERLQELLVQKLGSDPVRAAELATGRVRRWRKGMVSLLEGEAVRLTAAERPAEPAWVFPDGRRQERRLAFVGALAHWGEELVESVLAGCRDHLLAGCEGDWSEYRLEVPEPRESGPAEGEE